MSSITMHSNAISKPKVHRLPKIASSKTERPVFSFKYLLAASVVMLLGISLMTGEKKPALELKNEIGQAVMVPAISVGPQKEQGSILSDASTVLAHTIGDAQAAIGPVNTVGNTSAIISLHDNSEYIIGQMAKIAVDNIQITEVQQANAVDNRSARDLLSIISKH
jgi:hypothetical protein